ncbi:hypothetical protein LEP48_05420 [Isoptericola sp. NEAU-Y5]|uniref:Integral membrane protein n=1 Tax=Isoptericola luteus TaxID=2879484 RepID=A0ABS7ZCM1_9MICO|nr:hypothetical protein [Isoptericola sp. NEAU-Y5]MCA5892793.1 hypothetical protein [Isoptericola sp. NEAU-Y5]
MGVFVTPSSDPDPGADPGSGGGGVGTGPGDSPDGAGRPLGLRLVAVGVGIEAVVLCAIALLVTIELVRGGSNSTGVSIFLVAFFVGVAWVLVTATRSLWSGRRGGRAPLVVWQIMQGLVSVSLLTQGATPWVLAAAAGLLLVALVVLVSLVSRRVVEATSS